ncbi:phosphoethanolamine transferase [Photobacterium proteolyticum]|uniref:Phosphoethanolamine transferase n=1 Tax=Photobacterium proteolyticum TaxID=1903952 RepID=A0A1Q9H1L3_9GAMM|nr:phosphoethanolamine--lipid A transferase [Photobacterium proteolyticum]OLQ81395.1 phosphoethanolamine transferase [Photobacterium proteolyticum]
MNKIKNFLSYKEITFVSLPIFLALYFSLIVNFPILSELNTILSKLESVKVGFIISIPVFFFAAFNFIFNLFSWPYLSRPFFALLLIVSSMVSYAMYNYGVIFDYGMIENIFETDTSEATSYLSHYSIFWTMVMGVLPALFLWKVKIKNDKGPVRFVVMKVASMATSLLIIAIIAFFFYKDYSSVGRNNSYLKKMIIPTHYVYSAAKYINNTYFAEPIEYKQIGLDAKQSDTALTAAQSKPTLFVFVLGETARAQNYELNGYERPTNLYTRDLGMISFRDVSSCGTATAVSVPCMYSAMPQSSYDKQRANNQDNFLDIMQRAGISLLWKENDGGDKDVAKRIPLLEIQRNVKNEFCNGSTCYDMALLESFDNDISAMKGNRMLTLHLIGSHGPTYYQRYPEDKRFFMPDCPRSDIENCSREEIINTYDNTILYTDFVISQTIAKLKQLEDKYNTALFYISDHGESLGENGLYLHGTPYSLAPDHQTQVPMMAWFSSGFSKSKKINTDCLKQAAEKNSYSQDNIFHSMLGIMDVETEVYNSGMDIFYQCRN